MRLDTWNTAIDQYTLHLRAGGSPETTIRARREHLQHAARRLPVVTPWQVTGDLLTAYFASQQAWAQETRRGRRATFRAFYGWALTQGHVTLDPSEALPVVKPAQPRPRPAPDEVYTAALTAASPRERLMLRLSAELGLRRAEVAQVHARDLTTGPGGAWLTVHGKGNKQRRVPVPDGLAAELRSTAQGGYVFPGADQGHLSARWVGKLIARIMPEGWTMHSLRHRFGTRAYAVDRDLLTVQRLLGHANPATTRVYVALPDEALRATVAAVAA